MKIFADKNTLSFWKQFALMGVVAFFAACGDDASSVKPVDDDPGSDISPSSESPSSSSEDNSRSFSSSHEDKSSSSVKSSSSEQSSSEKSSSSSKDDALSSSEYASSSSGTDVSSSSVTLKEFPLESYTKDSFKNPDIEYQTMTDERDGHVYRIVTVGTGDSAMTWMAENLNFSENTTDSALAINLKSQTSCPFGKEEGCDILGRFYTWTAATNISTGYQDSVSAAKKVVSIRNHQGVCPSGWHLPTIDEFQSLFHRNEEIIGVSRQGIALKSKVGWNDSLSANNDIFGLSFVPGESTTTGFVGYVWLADADYAGNGSTRTVFETDMDYTFFNSGTADWNAYVRCVKNKDVASGKFKDSRDGKYYKYAYIGNTRWMAENLNYGNDSLGICSWDDDENCSEYGRFYTYEEARTVCPDGWRLPTENDFSELVENVGGSTNAAVYLRSTEWGGDLPGINAYGFSAKPTGLFRWGKTTDSFGRVEPQLGFSSGSFHMWLSSMNSLLMVTILDWSNSSYSVKGALTYNIDGVNESPLVPVRCVQ